MENFCQNMDCISDYDMKLKYTVLDV